MQIVEIAGHVNHQMLARYSQIRMQAKRAATEETARRHAANGAQRGKVQAKVQPALAGAPAANVAQMLAIQLRQARARRLACARSVVWISCDSENARLGNPGDFFRNRACRSGDIRGVFALAFCRKYLKLNHYRLTPVGSLYD